MKRSWDPVLQKGISTYKGRKRKTLSKILLIVLLFAIGGLIVACGGRKPVQIALESSRFLNLDDSGAPLPVIVRIYQLKGKDNMEKADFISLWKADKDILGEDLLDRSEMTLAPDTAINVKVDFREGSEYLAVMALFRKPQGENWRQIIPLKGSKVRSVRITVHERSIKIANIQ